MSGAEAAQAHRAPLRRPPSDRPLRVKMISPAKTAAGSRYWRSIKYSLFPPLGLATLAGYLDPDDEIDLQDEHVEKLRLDDDPDLVVRVQIPGKGGEAQRREQRVLDRAPVAAVGRRLGRADHLDPERTSGRRAAKRRPVRRRRLRARHARPPGRSAKWASSTSSPVSNSPGRSHTARRMPTRIMLG